MEYIMIYIFICFIFIVLLIFFFNGFINVSFVGSVIILLYVYFVVKFYKFMLGWDSYICIIIYLIIVCVKILVDILFVLDILISIGS